MANIKTRPEKKGARLLYKDQKIFSRKHGIYMLFPWDDVVDVDLIIDLFAARVLDHQELIILFAQKVDLIYFLPKK